MNLEEDRLAADVIETFASGLLSGLLSRILRSDPHHDRLRNPRRSLSAFLDERPSIVVFVLIEAADNSVHEVQASAVGCKT